MAEPLRKQSTRPSAHESGSKVKGAAAYRVIFGLDYEERNLDSKHRVDGRGITIVSTFRWVTPCRALQRSKSNGVSS